MDFEIRIKPPGETLAAYHRCRERVSIIIGPLGSGKTYQSCQRILTQMIEQAPDSHGTRKSRWYAVRNTYTDLSGTTIKDWMGLFGDLGRFKDGGRDAPTHYIDFDLGDGTRVQAELIFLAMERPEHVRKLRGAQATGFWLNEVKELDKAVVDMCDLRHGRYPSKMDGGPTWRGMIGDTNAPDEDHYLYNLAEEMQPKGWRFFIQPGGVIRAGARHDGSAVWIANDEAENLHNLPDGYYVEGMAGKSDDWIAVNLANEYGSVTTGKPVYTEYSDRVHLSPEPLEVYGGLPLLIGWDFGLTPAAIIGQVSRQGQLRILREIVGDNIGVKQFAKSIVLPVLANHYHGFELLSPIDPSGTGRSDTDMSTCFEILEKAGLNPVPARTNDFVPRREAVAGFLNTMVSGQPGFLLDPSCRTLRRGFTGGYHYRRMQLAGEARFTDKPDKNSYSHPHDALQYLALEAAGEGRNKTIGAKFPGQQQKAVVYK